jgi:lysophospholipase L1-like esterase
MSPSAFSPKKRRYAALVWPVSFLLLALLVEVAFRLTIFREESVHRSIYEGIVTEGNVAGYVAQPYLNYINNPALLDGNGNKAINSMGIRYPREVAIPKPDSTFRVLFLGGSTTFGDVLDSYEMFSMLAEHGIRRRLDSINPRYTDIECLNAGAHAHTSAEMLTHYQFKHRYLQPDLIVLHTGVNDAFSYSNVNGAAYQPDYHNSRRIFPQLAEVTPRERLLMRSRVIAYAIIHLRFSEYLENSLESNAFYHFTPGPLWFPYGNDSITSPTYNAFYRNITSLVTLGAADGADVLLVPEVIDSTLMPTPFDAVLPQGLRLHASFLERIASEQKNTRLLVLDRSAFSSDVFRRGDGIHVHEEGERIKARYIETAIAAIIKNRNNPDTPAHQ